MLSVICFSKNRAWQLKEYLRSALVHLKGDVGITVLYSCSPEFEERYLSLSRTFPQVKFVGQTTFETDLLTILGRAADHVMFGVDDAFWYGDFAVDDATKTLDACPKVFGYHAKLHPGLTVCQTFGDVPQRVPPMTQFGSVLVFDRFEGTHDWNYPWEIVATVYRKSDILKLLRGCRRMRLSLGTPNLLEGEPAKLFMMRHPQSHQFGNWMACASRPLVSVISVNCVQEGQTPIFDTPYANAESLNQLFDLGVELDESHYRNKRFRSVHIGDFVLKS